VTTGVKVPDFTVLKVPTKLAWKLPQSSFHANLEAAIQLLQSIPEQTPA